MRQESACREDDLPRYSGRLVRICILCGDGRIESFEHGVSCEECGALFGRRR